MKKLKLNLDEIKVESFETNPANSGYGTVLGLGGFGPNLPESAFCDTVETCNNCGGGGSEPCTINQPTCGASCGSTCAYTQCNQNTCGVTCPNTCEMTCVNTCEMTCKATCLWC